MTPTFAQEEYAAALVQRLRDENQLSADSYGRRIYGCKTRQEMSELISQMKQELESLDKMGTLH